MKKILLLLFVFYAFLPGSIFPQRQMETLGRGLIAAKVSNGVYVNWRITGEEWQGTSYNLYRDGTLVNELPITGASNFLDTAGTVQSGYQVAAVIKGIEQEKCKEVEVLPNPYLEITLREIPKIPGVPESYYNNYLINDATVADLDGDGEYELIIKRMNEGYNSSSPFENKYYTLIEAYKLTGEHLWTIDVGPNIFHNVEIDILAYDFDGDGKAEIIMRTSEGTVDGEGNVLTNAQGTVINYRDKLANNGQWFETEGTEYISLFDGETGKHLHKVDMIAREPISQWGPAGTQLGGLAHRSCKFMFGAPYLDGQKPSVFVGRGIYHTIKWTAYDVVNKQLVPRWGNEPIHLGGDYDGQGNHNFSIADVDNDGCDEIIYGSMTLNNDGSGLYSTRLGHGDAIHVGNFDPYRKGLEVFACLENDPYNGTTLRAAEDGRILLQWVRGSDQGRAMAANITNDYPGAMAWPSSWDGNKVWAASLREEVSLPQGSQNFRIYWDGDLLSELLDHNWDGNIGKGTGRIEKYSNGSWSNLFTTTYYSCNHSKGTPCLQADIFGDWREEVIWRSNDESKIRIYFTTIPTEHRIYTLMHDHQYRQAIAWQNVGYNQPPHPSFFLGEREGILLPPPPVMANDKMIFKSGNNWNAAEWEKDGQQTTYSDGNHVLFDYSVGNNSTTISLNQTVAPEYVTVNSRYDYQFEVAAAGKMTGDMKLIKQGSGTLSFDGTHDYTGTTEIWDGLVEINGELTNSLVWLNWFAGLSANGTFPKGIELNYNSILYPGLKEKTGSLTIGDSLIIKDNSFIEFDLASPDTQQDRISVNGDITIGNEVEFLLNTNDLLEEGDYPIISFTGTFTGSVENIITKDPRGYVVKISLKNNQIVLSVSKLRANKLLVWDGSQDTGAWNYSVANFISNDTPEYFIPGDDVLFNDASAVKTVSIETDVEPTTVTIETADTYTFRGTGKITGEGSLTVEKGIMQITNKNDFTGATYVNEGAILALSNMPYLDNGSIGVPSDDPRLFVINGGVLTNTGSNTLNSGKALTIGEKGATIRTNSTISFYQPIVGKTLIKEGSGTLQLFEPLYENYTQSEHEESILKEGTLNLRSEFVLPGNKVVFEGGTLQCYDNSGSGSTANWNMEVAENQTGTVNMDSRCEYLGTLTGGGTLTIMVPYVRNNIRGNWSEFQGTLRVTTDGDGGSFCYTDSRGLPNAHVNFLGTSENGKIAAQNTNVNFGGSTFPLGALSGNAYAILDGNWRWEVGNVPINTTFAGVIQNSGGLTKIGEGTLTLTNANTYTGTTIVNGGILRIGNTIRGGSATGSGSVTVNSGAALEGSGTIQGSTTIRSGATLQPGDHTAGNVSLWQGTMTFNMNLTLEVGSNTHISLRHASTTQFDQIVVKNRLTISGGNLIVSSANTFNAFPAGIEVKIFDSNRIDGEFDNIQLPGTASGVIWDTSDLYTGGIIRTIAGTSLGTIETSGLKVYPNPVTDVLFVETEPGTEISICDLNGNVIYKIQAQRQRQDIDLKEFRQGAYIVKAGNKTRLIIKQ